MCRLNSSQEYSGSQGGSRAFGEPREGRNEGSVSISHSVVGQWLSPDHSLEAQFLHERETVLNSDRLTNARWPH